MNYLQIEIQIPENETRELLIAALDECAIEGFEENTNALIAFVPEKDYNPTAIADLLTSYKLPYTVTAIPKQNWNEQWEENFQPVVIGDFCTIRAHFHTTPITTQHDIIITPKMSFGTGHHATTRLMVEQMAEIDCSDKRVFDFGTGTGVLAILADKLGATDIIAIDNDEWSYENACENVLMNHCAHIDIRQGVLEDIDNIIRFDIILANINRHILLAYMDSMYQLLGNEGVLLMSGLLTEDETIISNAATASGFTITNVHTLGSWICIKCRKH